MARGFSKEEKEQIRENLIEEGRKLFVSQGFNDTSVAKLTEQVGIATGSFYNYFGSKEELFLTIFNRENNKLKEEIQAQVNLKQDPTEVAKTLIFQYLEGMKTNHILQYSFNEDLFKKIEQKTDYDPREESDAAYDLFLPLLKEWQQDGSLKELEPKFIFAFFDAIFYVFVHQEDIGTEFFPELLEKLIEYIMEGIKKDKK